jgi:hypothetical protein
MPARFRETSSRSAKFEFGAGVNAELERGPALPLPRPAASRSPGSGMGELRDRAGCKRHAWPVPPPASRWLPARASLGTP